MNSLSPHTASSVTCFCQCIHNFQFQKAKVWFSLLLFGCDDHSCIIIWLLWIGCGWGWCGLNRLGAESSVPANLTKYGAALSMPLVICTIRWISRPLAAYHHWFLSRRTEERDDKQWQIWKGNRTHKKTERSTWFKSFTQLRFKPFNPENSFACQTNKNIVLNTFVNSDNANIRNDAKTS